MVRIHTYVESRVLVARIQLTSCDIHLLALHNLARYDSSRITSGGKSNSIVGRLHSVSSNPFLTEMIGAGLMKSIETLKDRPWSDLDILEGMTILRFVAETIFDPISHHAGCCYSSEL